MAATARGRRLARRVVARRPSSARALICPSRGPSLGCLYGWRRRRTAGIMTRRRSPALSCQATRPRLMRRGREVVVGGGSEGGKGRSSRLGRERRNKAKLHDAVNPLPSARRPAGGAHKATGSSPGCLHQLPPRPPPRCPRLASPPRPAPPRLPRSPRRWHPSARRCRCRRRRPTRLSLAGRRAHGPVHCAKRLFCGRRADAVGECVMEGRNGAKSTINPPPRSLNPLNLHLNSFLSRPSAGPPSTSPASPGRSTRKSPTPPPPSGCRGWKWRTASRNWARSGRT